MRVLISGASGLVGQAVATMLRGRGDSVIPLIRADAATAASRGGVAWQPVRNWIDAAGFENAQPDAVIHLAGESVAGGRWTAERKRRIRESRVLGTQLLASTLAALTRKPKVLISASATGVYGDRGDEPLDESSRVGDTFLAELARDWERATGAAEQAGVRVVHLRIGLVLSSRGGALKAMLTPFRWGLGGVIGGGEQYLSWISLTDLLSVIRFLLERDDLRGAINSVSPNPATNRQFTRTLGRVLRRPTILPLPAFVVRAVFGEMGDAALLSSTRVLPRRLQEAGFRFQHETLDAALRAELTGVHGVSDAIR